MYVSILLRYMSLVSKDKLRADVSKHGPFYSLCQAMFYVFVFRHKQILETDGGMNQHTDTKNVLTD